MVRKSVLAVLILLVGTACATLPVVEPGVHIEDLPADVTMRLPLGDRIAAADAWAALKAGRPDQAKKAILRMDPTSPVHSVGMAYVSLLLSDQAAAEEGFRRSLASDPDMVPARVGLAQVHEARRDREKAFEEYREILKRDPENRWAKPRYEAARDDLLKAARADAHTAQAAGDLEAAKAAFRKVLDYAPDDASAHLALARILRQEKDAAGAGEHFRAALSGPAPDRDAVREFAEFLAESGELGQSLEVYEKLRELAPADESVLKRIEELKAKLGIFELPSEYAGLPAAEAITREDLAALIAVKFDKLLGVASGQPRILVDISLSWAQRYIVRVASLGIMSVYDNHTFQPRRIINRAELAEAAVRLIRTLQAKGHRFVPLLEPRRIQVADVSPDNLFYPSIIQALAYQVLSLTPERNFEPERTVTGREAIRVLDLILGLAK